jgi:hypothetical protein
VRDPAPSGLFVQSTRMSCGRLRKSSKYSRKEAARGARALFRRVLRNFQPGGADVRVRARVEEDVACLILSTCAFNHVMVLFGGLFLSHCENCVPCICTTRRCPRALSHCLRVMSLDSARREFVGTYGRGDNCPIGTGHNAAATRSREPCTLRFIFGTAASANGIEHASCARWRVMRQCAVCRQPSKAFRIYYRPGSCSACDMCGPRARLESLQWLIESSPPAIHVGRLDSVVKAMATAPIQRRHVRARKDREGSEAFRSSNSGRTGRTQMLIGRCIQCPKVAVSAERRRTEEGRGGPPRQRHGGPVPPSNPRVAGLGSKAPAF